MSANNVEELLPEIAELHQLSLKNYQLLTGGDINQVYLLETNSTHLVIKLNHAKEFPKLFVAEKAGLESLFKLSTIDVPEPLYLGEHKNWAYLIMEYKPEGIKKSSFWEGFGVKLAGMHQQTSKKFGFEMHNYIGSLLQYNEEKTNASDFYIEMRLKPQLQMAKNRGYDLKISEKFFHNCSSVIPQEKSSLVHGDLWSGNYLVNQSGEVCLIDPAVAYAPREMDLAMMQLFGGFHKDLFAAYQEVFPLEPGFNNRVSLWQLYYLLVHLNIFGAGYKAQVDSIVKRFS